MLSIRVFSNCDRVTLKRNGTELQTLTGANYVIDGYNPGVVYQFDETQFFNEIDSYEVIGYNLDTNGNYVEVATHDVASFKTYGEYLNTENLVEIDIKSFSSNSNATTTTFNITANTA